MWLRNATTLDGRRIDLSLNGGLIQTVAPAGFSIPGDRGNRSDRCEELDLTGRILLPSFVEPHAHLDKAMTAGRTAEFSGDLMAAIADMDRIAADFTDEDFDRRADAALQIYLAHGTTAVRTHVTLGGNFGTRAMATMVGVRKRWRGRIDVQLVAMAGIPVRAAEIEQALAAGADVVGAYPHADHDPARAVQLCFDVAEAAGVPVDLHTDETLRSEVLTLDQMAERVASTGFPHGVTASHCVSLGVQTEDVQRQVSEQVAAAGIAVVTLPLTNLYLLGRGVGSPAPRTLTALAALYDAGVTVAAGGDNLRDTFHPLGRGDALETATLMVRAGHRTIGEAFDSVTTAARSALGLPPIRVEAGGPADLVAVIGDSPADALARADQDRLVWKAGRLVARTTVSTEYRL